MLARSLRALFAALSFAALAAPALAGDDGIIRVKSACSVPETIARIKADRQFGTATGVIASITASIQAK